MRVCVLLARACTPSERERERKREKRERERYREREMKNMVIEFISLLLTMAALKGMMGVLAPFSYLVWYIISLSYG